MLLHYSVDTYDPLVQPLKEYLCQWQLHYLRVDPIHKVSTLVTFRIRTISGRK
jgi:hypothetical protein